MQNTQQNTNTPSPSSPPPRIHKGVKIDDSILERTLIPYKRKKTIYLKEAYAEYVINDPDSEPENTARYSVKGSFSIPESCYIDDTGHFNAVEFNICYNQLMYISFAYTIDKGLISAFDLSLEEYYHKQLSNVYITHLESHYKHVINPRNFHGVFKINKAKKRQGLIMVDTDIEFSDDGNGLAYGNVGVVIV